MSNVTFTIITYDVRTSSRRLQVAKILESVGSRVQRSVFEAYLDERTMNRLIRRLEQKIDLETDSIRIYTLCMTCRRQIRLIGQGKISRDEEVYVF